MSEADERSWWAKLMSEVKRSLRKRTREIHPLEHSSALLGMTSFLRN